MSQSQVKQILEEFQLHKVLRTTVHTTVFQASDPRSGRAVAIKLINPAGPIAEEANRLRFIQALEVAKSGSVVGLPRTLDYGFTPEQSAYIVSELVDSSGSAKELRGGPPAPAAAVLLKVLNAVDELANAGVAHLNLCPENVLVAGTDQVGVVGFGTGSYLVGAPSAVWPTAEHPFAAPELTGRGVLGRHDLWRADLYSLALMACDLFTFETNGAGTDAPSVRIPNRLHKVFRARKQLEKATAAALRADPATRDVTVSQLREALLAAVPDAAGMDLGDLGEAMSFDTMRIHVPDELMDGPPSGGGVAGAEPQSVAAARVDVVPEPIPRAAGKSKRPRWLLPAVVAAAGVAAVTVIAVVVVLWLGTRGPAPSPTPVPQAEQTVPTRPPREVAPQPPPTPTAHPALADAKRLIAEDDLDGARAALETIDPSELETLSVEDSEIFQRLSVELTEDDRDDVGEQLATALHAGSIPMLRRATAKITELGLDDQPELRSELQRARRALQVHGQLWQAKKSDDHFVVLERSAEMIGILPAYSGSYTMRDGAASAIEGEVGSAVARRDFDQAVFLLERLQAVWPDRVGLADRIQWCRDEKANDVRQGDALEQALKLGAAGDPEAGLRMLDGIETTEFFAGRYDDARGSLNRQLTAMDAGHPTVALPVDFQFKYRKNETVVVPLDVSDDYRVQSVVAWVKTSLSPTFNERRIASAAGGRLSFEISPELHDNGPIEFYVVVTDRSGHEGRIGGPQGPLRIERKRWYNR